MKQIYLSLLFICFGTFLSAQADAPNFNVTDLDGNNYDLYEILESGKVVVLDASATWCPPCWSFHNGEFLKDIQAKYGPDGTDQVVVLFYEGDANTDDDALAGTGNTQGNWLEGANYPFINESPITLNSSVWWPLGFPTINVVRPADKKIIADLYDPWVAGLGLAGMEEIIEGAFPSTTSTEDLKDVQVDVFPNPFMDEVVVDLTNTAINASSIRIVDIKGALVKTVTVESNTQVRINTQDLVNGLYLLNVYDGQDLVGTIKLTK